MINTIFQLKIILIGSKPTIWRRIEVDANTLLTGGEVYFEDKAVDSIRKVLHTIDTQTMKFAKSA